MRFYYTTFVVVFFVLTSSFANVVLPPPYQTQWHSEVAIMGGVSFVNFSHEHSTLFPIVVVPAMRLGRVVNFSHVYNPDGSTSINGLGGIYIAMMKKLARNMEISVGPSFYFLNIGKIKGNESVFLGGAQYASLHYHFHIQSFPLFLETRFSFTNRDWVPYLIGGVGVAWNNLYGFSESLISIADPTGPLATNPLQSKRQTAFAYEVGIGIQHLLYTDVKNQMCYRLGLEYRYFNNGFGRFNPGQNQLNKDTLYIRSIDANAVLVSLMVSG